MKKLYRRMLRQRPRVIAAMLALMIIVATFPLMVIAENTDNVGTAVTPTDAVVMVAPDQTETVTDTDVADIQKMMALGTTTGDENVTAMPEDARLQVTMTTNRSSISIGCYASDTIYVDLGDGKPVEIPIEYGFASGTVSGTVLGTIKVYCSGDIYHLDLFNQGVETLDVTNCDALSTLDCYGNNLTELVLNHNPELGLLDCGKNNLSSLDLSGNPRIYNLFCDDNNLTKLDCSGLSVLVEMDCSRNNITSLTLPQNGLFRTGAYGFLWCGGNNLTFSNLDTDCVFMSSGCYDFMNQRYVDIGVISQEELDATYQYPTEYPTFVYTPQGKLQIAASIGANTTIDLSSEWNANGKETVYKWYDRENNPVMPASSAQGKFTFDNSFNGKKLYCKMTNASLPELTLETTEVEIIANPVMSLEVIDNMNVDASAGLSDDISVVDGNGDGYIGKLKLIIGNVAGNTKNTVLDAIEAYNKEFKASEDNYAMYDISLFDGNKKKVEIVDGRIKVTLKIPDNLSGKGKNYTFKLYHYDEDAGKLEEVAITLSNGSSHYTFYADDFSPYALVYKEKKSEGSANSSSGDAKTGDSSGSALALALNLFMLAALAVYAFRPKSKERA